MEEEKNENIDSKNDEETTEETTTAKSEETPEEATTREKELIAKNKKLFARATKAEDKLKDKKVKKIEKKTPDGSDPLVAVQLGKALKDFSEEEIGFICKYAGSSDPEKIIEASKDEWVLSAITSKREKVAKEKKIPDPSNPTSKRKEDTPEASAKNRASHKVAWQKNMQGGAEKRTGI